MSTSEPTHRNVQCNGVRLHVAEAGPAEGPLLLLLHGFPDAWFGWRHQIEALAAAGYRVWAVDQRGYNLSEKPPGRSAYTLDRLAADVVGLIEAAGRERATLIGHDWGAAVAWWLAGQQPERVERLVAINVPHPAVMIRFLRQQPRQLLRSWYIFFFQLPWLPEWLLRQRDFRGLVGMLLASSGRGAFSRAEMPAYRAAWARPRALTSMIHWYRAIAQKQWPGSHPPAIRVPTLLLWGEQDIALDPGLAEASIALCRRGRLVRFPELSHWPHRDDPERVNRLILDFLAEPLADQGPKP